MGARQAMAFMGEMDRVKSAAASLGYSSADVEALAHIHQRMMFLERRRAPVSSDFKLGLVGRLWMVGLDKATSWTEQEVKESTYRRPLYDDPEYRAKMIAAYARVTEYQEFQGQRHV